MVESSDVRRAREWSEREASRLGVTPDDVLQAMRLRGWLIHQIERLDPLHIKRLKEMAPPDKNYANTIREFCANSDRRWY